MFQFLQTAKFRNLDSHEEQIINICIIEKLKYLSPTEITMKLSQYFLNEENATTSYLSEILLAMCDHSRDSQTYE